MQPSVFEEQLPVPTSAAVERAKLGLIREQLGALWAQVGALEPHAALLDNTQRMQSLRAGLVRALGEIESLGARLMEQCESRVLRLTFGDRRAVRELELVGDVCFMATTETRTKRHALSELSGTDDRARLLSVCSSAFRRARKALISVDGQLSRALGEPQVIDTSSRLQESLEIRVAYSILRRTAEGSAAPADEQLRTRLRAIELRIQLLSEKELFGRLRIDDRLELCALQRRLLDWLSDASDVKAGMRLYQDALGFTQLLAQVNLRQEVRLHDAALIDVALTRIEGCREPRIDEATWSMLRPLLGLHDALDDLIRLDQRERVLCLPVLRGLSDAMTPSRTFTLPAGFQDDGLDTRSDW